MFVEHHQLIVLFVVFVANVRGQTQLISPCPDLFQYEPQNPNEPDRWYGTITILSDSELSGVWLRLIFDKPPVQLGNWFGEVVIKDKTDYLVKSPNHKVAPNTPYKMRFYVRYNPRKTPPMLHSFRLNTKPVCPPIGGTTAAPVLAEQTSTRPELVTVPSPVVVPSVPVSTGVVGPSSFQGFRPPSSSNEEDDFFPGDFSPFNNPLKPSFNLDSAACGTVVSPPLPLIPHGPATHEAEFEWHAALYHPKGMDLTYICGASLITRYHLITVAHCVTRRKTTQPVRPDSLVVYLGKFYLRRWSNPGIQDKQVEQINPHPKYDAQSFNNDIAIIKLASAVHITNFVRPVSLWDDDLQLSAVVSKTGTVVGWGFDESGKVTEQLTKAEMSVVSQETCIFSNPDFYSLFTSAKTFCAGFKNGTSVCNGDSGGGMVFPKAMTQQGGTIWQLRGLVSISVALQNQLKCDATNYVVFTDVAKYLDWIKAILNEIK